MHHPEYAYMYWHDERGFPCAGGEVWYDRPVFMDAARTILHSNPVILDANGGAVIYADVLPARVVNPGGAPPSSFMASWRPLTAEELRCR